MSRVTKAKHVMKEMLADDFEHPIGSQMFARILASRGNNLHEAESPDRSTETFLVSMPTKFRRNVWIKRGDFVIVQPIDEGDKVKAEIVRILTPQHIKEFTKDGIWPSQFLRARPVAEPTVSDSGSDSGDDGLVKNTNRRHHEVPESSSDDESDSEVESSSEETSKK